jgi:hypothetical protein
MASQLSDTLWAVIVGGVLAGTFGVGGNWLSDRRRSKEARRDRRERNLIELQTAAVAFGDAISIALSSQIAHEAIPPREASALYRSNLGLSNPAARLGDPISDGLVDESRGIAIRVMEGDLTVEALEAWDGFDRLQRRVEELFREFNGC